MKNKKSLNFATNLLDKLLKREPNKYNCLVLNLYDIDRGYSLGFHVHDNIINNNNDQSSSLNSIETDLLSYDETELLFYVNAGEIPPILIDLVDRLNVNQRL